MQRKTVVLLPPKKRVRDWSQEKKPKQAILLRLQIQVHEQHGVCGEGRGERGEPGRLCKLHLFPPQQSPELARVSGRRRETRSPN